MRCVHRDVHTSARLEFVNHGTRFKLRLVSPGAVVYRPKAFQLFIGSYLAVLAIEEVDFLIPGNLQQPRALTIDVVRRGAPRRADKQDGFKPLDLLAHLLARPTEEVTDGGLENFPII